MIRHIMNAATLCRMGQGVTLLTPMWIHILRQYKSGISANEAYVALHQNVPNTQSLLFSAPAVAAAASAARFSQVSSCTRGFASPFP